MNQPMDGFVQQPQMPIQPTPQMPTPPAPMKPAKSRKKLALFLMIAPFAGLIGTIILYAVIAFVMNVMMSATDSGLTNQTLGLAQQPSTGMSIALIINAILGLVGLLSTIGIFTAFPAGVILLILDSKKNK